MHSLSENHTLYLKSGRGSKCCTKLKFRIKLISPYLVVQENIWFAPTFDKDLRIVKHVVQGRTGTKSCLPSIAFRAVYHLCLLP